MKSYGGIICRICNYEMDSIEYAEYASVNEYGKKKCKRKCMTACAA
jgi:hypothetical protein